MTQFKEKARFQLGFKPNTMACSKPTKDDFNQNVSEKINKIDCGNYNGSINKEEIIMFCKIEKEKPVSLELIRNMLGGPNMDYPVMELSDSIECYEFCRNDLIKNLKETKFNIEYFEDRVTTNANIIISVVKKSKKSGGEQICIWAVIRMTMIVTPKVGFCRYFQLTGECIFMFSLYLKKSQHIFTKLL